MDLGAENVLGAGKCHSAGENASEHLWDIVLGKERVNELRKPEK